MNVNRDLSNLSVEELDRVVTEMRERFRSEDAAETTTVSVPPPPEAKFPRETLLWLALSPFWTSSLAQACGFPPAGGLPVEQTLEALHREGLADKVPLPSFGQRGSRADCYVVSSAARSRLLSPYQAGDADLAELREILSKIGQAVLAADLPGPDVTPPLRRWATLAAHATDAQTVADVFEQQTMAAFNERRSDELLNWIDTGRPLTGFYRNDLESPLKMALQKASRRLELFFRREIDEKHLAEARFFERDDQIGAFREFMQGPDAEWALHFVGAGGVGKTMLMRKITTGLAEEMGAITARIDFDYFNADYPRLAPGVLLWSFGQELRPYDQQNSVIGQLDDADRNLRDLHSRLSDGTFQGESALSTRNSLFQGAIVGYISALKALSRQLDRKVLLIVDTCEELARSRPDGTVPENVEETFRILRALHDGPQTLNPKNSSPSSERGMPGLKVIFSGRRLLADRGLDWHLKHTEEPPPPGREHVTRPYLKLFEIRGFTHDEARRYLTSDPDVPADPALVEAIIARSSPEAGGIKGLVFENQAGRPAEAQRCHPYEFIFYRDWAKEKPTPSPQTIRTATSKQFVELRILKRLRSAPLQSLMPAVSLLGRFNRETLEAVSDIDPKEFASAFEDLQRQDWIDLLSEATSDGAESRLVLNAKYGVRKRLLAYYFQLGELKRVQEKAARYLENLTLKSDLSHLDWSSFDAALRVLDLDPAPGRAARWWEQAVERILKERDWTWLDTLLSYLRAEDGAAGARETNARALASEQLARDAVARPEAARPVESLEPPESCMRPAVLATYAAALTNRRDANRSELSEVWRQVLEKAEEGLGHDYAGAQPHELRLLMRARAGVVTASRHLGAPPEPRHVEELWRTIFALEEEGPLRDALDEQVLAALVAGVETVVDHVEMEAARGKLESARALFYLGGGPPPDPLAPGDDTFAPRKLDQVFIIYRHEQPAHTRHLVALRVFFFSLAGRALALCGRYPEAEVMLEGSLDLIASDGFDGAARPPLGWFDWQPPGDLAARVRLEFVRAACPWLKSHGELLKLAEAWPDGYGIDAERVRSSLIGLRLALGPVVHKTLTGTGVVGKDDGLFFDEVLIPREPETCEAHRSVPPLFVSVAEAFATAGRVDEALRYLERLLGSSQQLGPAVTLHVERAHARIARRMRTYEDSPREYEALEKSGRVADAAMAWALDGLRGRRNLKPIPVPPPGVSGDDARAWLHAICQTRYTGGDKWTDTSEWAEYTPGVEDDFLTLSLFFDHLELRAVEQKLAMPIDFWQKSIMFDPSAWFERHPTRLEEALTICTRHMLLTDSDRHLPLLERLTEEVGPRRAAEVIRREAELLALRAPRSDTFARPLKFILDRLAKNNDHVSLVTVGLTHLMLNGRGNVRKAEDAWNSANRALLLLEAEAKLWPQSAFSLRAEGIDSLVANELPSDFKSLGTRAWRPWLVRFLFIDAEFIKDEKERAARVTWLRNLFFAAKPSESAQALALPPDLETWLGAPTKKDSIWLNVAAMVLMLFFIAVGFYVMFRFLRWVLSFTPLDISGWSDGRQVVFFILTLPAVVLLIWRLLAETRQTIAETQGKEPEPASIFQGWQSTAVCAVIFALSCAALLLKIGRRWLYPDWLPEWGWFENLSGPGEAGSYWHVLWSALIFYGFLLPGSFLLFRSVRTFRRVLARATLAIFGYIASLFSVWLIIRPAAGTEGTRPTSRTEVPPVALQHQVRAPWPFSLFEGYVGKREPERVIIPPFATYGEMAEAAPSLAEASASLPGILGRRNIEVQLDLAKDLHAPCWEALLMLPNAKGEQGPHELPFRFRRISESARKRTSDVTRPGFVSWHGSDIAGEMSKRGWRLLNHDSHFATIQYYGDGVDPFTANLVHGGIGRGEGPYEVGFLHLVGTTEDTGEGVRFRLARNELSRMTQSADGSRLLDAESLVERLGFPNLSLCVIQGDPDKWDAGERSDDARGKAMLARIFASKLFDHGVPAVLVIPPLRAQLGTDVLAEVARILKRRPRRATSEMMEAVARMQRMIFSSYEHPTDTPKAWEEALDVCLYAERLWSVRLPAFFAGSG